MNCGIFVSRVEKGSKAAEVGLKRGDQILEVNSSNFEHAMTLAKATTLLLETTHLAITVKSNLLGESKVWKLRDPTTLKQTGILTLFSIYSSLLNRSHGPNSSHGRGFL